MIYILNSRGPQWNPLANTARLRPPAHRPLRARQAHAFGAEESYKLLES